MDRRFTYFQLCLLTIFLFNLKLVYPIKRGVLDGDIFYEALYRLIRENGYETIQEELETTTAIKFNNPSGEQIVSEVISRSVALLQERAAELRSLHDLILEEGLVELPSSMDCCTSDFSSTTFKSIFGYNVGLNQSCYGKSTLSPEKSRYPPDKLKNFFQNYQQEEVLLTQAVIGTEDGILGVVPAFTVAACDNFDVRRRDWYQGAATRFNKYVIILFDASINIGNEKLEDVTRFNAAKKSMEIILQGLGFNDWFTIVPSDLSKTNLSCIYEQPIKPSNQTINRVMKDIRAMETSNGFNFTDMLERAFSLLQKHVGVEKQPVIILLTSSRPQPEEPAQWRRVFQKYLHDIDMQWSMQPIILTFSLGAGRDLLATLRYIYPGVAVHLEAETERDLYLFATTYYKYLQKNTEGLPYLSQPYLTAAQTHVVLTLSMPVIQGGQLLGVVGLDILYWYLFSEVQKRGKLSSTSYFFLIDEVDNHVIYHPYYNFNSGVQYIQINELEVEPGVASGLQLILDSRSEDSGYKGKSGVLKSAIFVRLGDPFKEGVSKTPVNVVYYYGHIHVMGIHWKICYVSVEGSNEIQYELIQQEKTPRSFHYTRLDLSPPGSYDNFTLCTNVEYTIFKDAMMTFFTEEAFVDSIQKAFQGESAEDVQNYYDVVDGKIPNTMFTNEALVEIFVNAYLDELFTIGGLALELHPYTLYRGFSCRFGTAKFYPGVYSLSLFKYKDRAWYQEAVSFPDRIILPRPYMDGFGNGILITTSKAVFVPGTTEVFGVFTADISLRYINQLLTLYLWQDCASADFWCILVSASGFLIFHQKWPTEAIDVTTLTQHFIGQEPAIASHMFKRGYLKKLTCIDVLRQRQQYFYRVNLTFVDHLDEPNAWYKAVAVPGSNVFIIQQRTNVSYEPNGCVCLDGAEPECQLGAEDCECPCAKTIDTCTWLTNNLSYMNSSDVNLCIGNREFGLPVQRAIYRQERFESCTGRSCSLSTAEQSCLNMVQCQWCDSTYTGELADNPVCDYFSDCENGLLAKVIEKVDVNTILMGVFIPIGMIVLAALAWLVYRKGYFEKILQVTDSRSNTGSFVPSFTRLENRSQKELNPDTLSARLSMSSKRSSPGKQLAAAKFSAAQQARNLLIEHVLEDVEKDLKEAIKTAKGEIEEHEKNRPRPLHSLNDDSLDSLPPADELKAWQDRQKQLKQHMKSLKKALKTAKHKKSNISQGKDVNPEILQELEKSTGVSLMQEKTAWKSLENSSATTVSQRKKSSKNMDNYASGMSLSPSVKNADNLGSTMSLDPTVRSGENLPPGTSVSQSRKSTRTAKNSSA